MGHIQELIVLIYRVYAISCTLFWMDTLFATRATLQTVPPNDRLVILGDFNARVGTNHNVWAGVIGRRSGEC